MRAGMIVLCLLGVSVVDWLADAAIAADETKRIQASGSAECRGATTPEETIALARERARQEAVRRVCGTWVKSATSAVLSQRDGTVQNVTVSETHTSEEGLVIAEQWDKVRVDPFDDPSTKVPFVRYTVAGSFEVAPPPDADTGLSIRLQLNRRQLVAGQDTITMTVEPSEKVYAMVFNLAGDERVYPIYPNEHMKEALVLPGRTATALPREADPIVLRPQPAKGHKRSIERLQVIASRKPIAPPSWNQSGSLALPEFYRWQHRQLRLTSFVSADAVYEVHLPAESL